MFFLDCSEIYNTYKYVYAYKKNNNSLTNLYNLYNNLSV